MKTKLELAHDYLLKLIESQGLHIYQSDIDRCFDIADIVQAEAEKRKTSESPDVLREVCVEVSTVKVDNMEWQPDWSVAPEWANWWVIGSLTKQGVWSATKPNSAKINGVDYWEVTSPSGDEHLSVAPSFNYKGDWRDSLRKRPQ